MTALADRRSATLQITQPCPEPPEVSTDYAAVVPTVAEVLAELVAEVAALRAVIERRTQP